jgi:uncharacterized membrane protein YkvA (DUF1232 family)
MVENGFAEAMRAAILSLPQDLKAMLRVLEDPDLDDQGRVIASGALLHVLSASNAIPGVKGTLALVDDVLVLRLALERIAATSPDVVSHHRDDEPDIFEPWQVQLDAARAYLGERGINVLAKAVDGLAKITFQGHSARECARDQEAATWLYDSVHEAIVEQFEIAPDEVTRAVKNSHEILAKVSQRV